MAKKESKSKIDLVEEEILFWVNAFSIALSRLHIVSDFENEYVQELIDNGQLFSVSREASSAYEAHVFINPRILNDIPDEEIRQMACHEVIHMLLEQLCWACGVQTLETMNPAALSQHEIIADRLSALLSKEYVKSKSLVWVNRI